MSATTRPTAWHELRGGGDWCVCGWDTCVCQGCGAIVCGSLARWTKERGNLGPSCAPVCTTCGGFGEIDDPREPVPTSYEHRLELGPPATIPCPDPACPGAVR
jgi:hypothetical protein